MHAQSERKVRAMHCPFCQFSDSKVVDSRTADDGTLIRRRRECPSCKRRFTTLETFSLSVVKRSGVVEPFSRDKVVSGVRKACQGRPVSDHDLALLAAQVEESLRCSGLAMIPADEVGKSVLPYLRSLDVIAYLRFASVYSSFDSLDDFEKAIATLRAEEAQGNKDRSLHSEEDDVVSSDASVGKSDSAKDSAESASADSSENS